jgi:nucleoside-diphosphate-sugar epimerase
MNKVDPIDMGKTLLVTGADGFTGQHLSEQARGRGYQVIPLQSDLTRIAGIAEELSGKHFDYVVHLAAISSVTHADELAFYQVNLFGTLNLLKTLTTLSAAPSKVILASSANIYGNARESPIGEDTAAAPVNHYAMSKLAMEHMAANFGEQLPLITVRPFNYTGVGHDDRFVIPKLVRHFARGSEKVELGNIEVEREFNDVRTVCNAYLDLLTHGIAEECYNICSGNTHSLVDVIAILTRLSGHTLEIEVNPDFIRTNEVQRLCGNPQKLESCLGSLEHPPLEDTLGWMLGAATT